MNLEDINDKKLEENIPSIKNMPTFVNDFLNEINEFVKKSDNKKSFPLKDEDKYGNYWSSKKFIEDNVAAEIGLSRWGADNKYKNELADAVNDILKEFSKTEGAIYRKQFRANGSNEGEFYNVEKFEDGEITGIDISKNEIPEEFQDEDIIFQYNEDGTVKIRDDIRKEVIKLASQKSINLKKMENERNKEYKKEGHVYDAVEDDGYVFLSDITEKRGFVIEDIDFVVNVFNEEGKYQVIDGNYKKIED